MPPFDQFCLLELALRGPLLSFKFLLDWTYCFGDYGRYRILAFWLENAYSGVFLAVLGDFDPLKL